MASARPPHYTSTTEVNYTFRSTQNTPSIEQKITFFQADGRGPWMNLASFFSLAFPKMRKDDSAVEWLQNKIDLSSTPFPLEISHIPTNTSKQYLLINEQLVSFLQERKKIQKHTGEFAAFLRKSVNEFNNCYASLQPTKRKPSEEKRALKQAEKRLKTDSSRITSSFVSDKSFSSSSSSSLSSSITRSSDLTSSSTSQTLSTLSAPTSPRGQSPINTLSVDLSFLNDDKQTVSINLSLKERKGELWLPIKTFMHVTIYQRSASYLMTWFKEKMQKDKVFNIKTQMIWNSKTGKRESHILLSNELLNFLEAEVLAGSDEYEKDTQIRVQEFVNLIRKHQPVQISSSPSLTSNVNNTSLTTSAIDDSLRAPLPPVPSSPTLSSSSTVSSTSSSLSLSSYPPLPSFEEFNLLRNIIFLGLLSSIQNSGPLPLLLSPSISSTSTSLPPSNFFGRDSSSSCPLLFSPPPPSPQSHLTPTAASPTNTLLSFSSPSTFSPSDETPDVAPNVDAAPGAGATEPAGVDAAPLTVNSP